jgi:hypothetical protein
MPSAKEIAEIMRDPWTDASGTIRTTQDDQAARSCSQNQVEFMQHTTTSIRNSASNGCKLAQQVALGLQRVNSARNCPKVGYLSSVQVFVKRRA